jgi:hypothetical protein
MAAPVSLSRWLAGEPREAAERRLVFRVLAKQDKAEPRRRDRAGFSEQPDRRG